MSGATMSVRIPMHDALAAVRRSRRAEDVVITTMAAAKVWMEQNTTERDFVFVPSCMGQATSLGLGIALAQPHRRVIVCNGDGSMLMNLGSLVTIAAQAPENLAVILLDNGMYEVTGGQPTPATAGAPGAAGRVDWIALARGSGFSSVHHYADARWAAAAAGVLSRRGPHFILLDIEPDPFRGAPTSPGRAADRAAAFMAALRR